MSIIIEHEKRKREILEKAMDVFIDDGFGNATIQKIAERCGIRRPILYTYFRNKRDIFSYSIKQLLSTVENTIVQELEPQKTLRGGEPPLGTVDVLIKILILIIDILECNKKVLNVLRDYLVYIAKHPEIAGHKTPDYLIRRRTIKLRHILSKLVIDGINAGEIKNLDVTDITNLLYRLLESAILNLTVAGKTSIADVKKTAEFTIRLLGQRQMALP